MKRPVVLLLAVFSVLIGVTTYSALHHPIAILSPAGPIAHKERGLMYLALGLSIFILVPVFTMTAYIVWKYRATNRQAKYSPEFDRSRIAETIWWGIPTLIIAFLAVVTWNSAHSLDPYKPLSSSKKPLTVQVIALQWKWLFVYPEQHIASLNYFVAPAGRPINFQITADAPMNSFWIPQLGGQIYAMPGMITQLHLLASRPGNYAGSSANISGVGFANMHFIARARTQAEFNSWVTQAQHNPQQLTTSRYRALSAPTNDTRTLTFGSVQPLLFDSVVSKYGHAHGGY